MNLYIDTRENKSAIAWDRYFGKHLEIFELYHVEHIALEIGDIMNGCPNQKLIEYKIGNDALSSLNSGHLEQQLQRMRNVGDVEKYLIVVATDITTYSRCTTLAQKYGVMVYYRSSIDDAVKLSDHLIREVEEGRELHQDSTIPILEHKKGKNTPIQQRLALSLCQLIDGLSEEVAVKLISQSDNSLRSLVEREPTDTPEAKAAVLTWLEILLHDHYQKNMKVLAKKIYDGVWG